MDIGKILESPFKMSISKEWIPRRVEERERTYVSKNEIDRQILNENIASKKQLGNIELTHDMSKMSEGEEQLLNLLRKRN